MSRGFGLEVIEREGNQSRTAMTASDYEELAEKIAERAGVRVEPDDLLPDGGES